MLLADSDILSMVSNAVCEEWKGCLKRDPKYRSLLVRRLSRSDATYLLQQVRSTEPDKRPRIAEVRADLGFSGDAVVDQMVEFFSCCPLVQLQIDFGETADAAELGLVNKLCRIPTVERLRLKGSLDEVGMLEAVLLQLTSPPRRSQLKKLVVVDFLLDQHSSNEQILVDLINGHPQLEHLELDSCFHVDNRTESRVVDAIVAHQSLKWVYLPFHIIQGGAAIPLIRHFAEGNGELEWLSLDWVSLERVDDGGNSKTKFSVWDHDCVDWSVGAPNIGKMFAEVFCSNLSSISDVRIGDYLDPTDAEQLWQATNEYTNLTRLSLKVERFPSSTLCPLSALREVELFSGHSALEMISFADLLSQQQQLQKLWLCLSDFQDDGAGGEYFVKFQKALKYHPSLHTLHVCSQHKPSKFILCMFGALECNKVIKTLDLDMWLDSVDCVSVCLPRLKHVKKLLLRDSGSRFGFFGDGRPSPENAALLHELHELLKLNTSICSLASNHLSEPPPFVQNHVGISKVLRRNTLLDHVESFMDTLPTVSAGFWADMVVKLGANEGEPTPLYALCKSLAAASLLG